jgi:O-antigen/teichoic acid export membrane protein
MTQGQIFSFLRFIPLFLLASFFKASGILISLSIAVFVSVVTAASLFLPRVESDYFPRFEIKRQIIKDMMRYSIANYITGILWMLPQFVLPLIVVNLMGAEQNAYFFIGWSVASMLFSIPSATSFSLFAEGSYDEKQLFSKTKKSLKLILFLLIPTIIILIIFGNTILTFFGAAYCSNVTTLLRILVFSAIPLSINYVYYGVKRVEMKMKPALVLSAFIAFTTLGLTYILLPLMGILGAGLAWLISQTISAIAIIYDLLKHHK